MGRSTLLGRTWRNRHWLTVGSPPHSCFAAQCADLTVNTYRRSRQLFLNQRRYDMLIRNVWLQHGIPSVISRKLEAELNTGGWDSF
jgi:hypothetical protein